MLNYLPSRNALRLMLVAASLMPLAPSLTACVTMTGSGVTECGWVKPITWSKRDTDQTIIEVKQHNAAWKANCR